MFPFLVNSLQNGGSFDFGKCLYISNALGNSLQIPQSAVTDFGVGDFTFSFWMYMPLTIAQSNYDVLSKNVNFDQFFRVRADVSTANGRPRVRIFFGARNAGASTSGSYFSQNYMSLGTWNLIVAGRRDGGYFACNNAFEELFNPPQASLTIARPFTVGGAPGLFIDSIAFFNRGISASECTYLYNSGLGNSPAALPGLVALYRLDEPAGSRMALNSVAGGVDATLAGYAVGAKDFVSHTTLS